MYIDYLLLFSPSSGDASGSSPVPERLQQPASRHAAPLPTQVELQSEQLLTLLSLNRPLHDITLA